MARARRELAGVVLLAAALHGLGIARSTLPAQDGLKFIRAARQLHAEPWADVVRGTDRHPLYPALIALAQPGVRLVAGPGPDSWRIAAQSVSAVAALGLLLPLYGLARTLFDARTAILTTLLWVLLPLPAEVGHESLSDSMALLCALGALRLGEMTLRGGRLGTAIGCGLVAGCGYLARPEVALAPMAVAVAAVLEWARLRLTSISAQMIGSAEYPPPRPSPLRVRVRGRVGVGGAMAQPVSPSQPVPSPAPAWRCMPALVVFLAIVGSYATVKGEISEKLALRIGGGLSRHRQAVRNAPQLLPRGLDHPRLHFAPKEESEAPRTLPAWQALGRVLDRWAESLGWALLPLALWGAVRAATAESGRIARLLVAVYLLVFVAVLVRHVSTLGYLSGRHTLAMAIVALPWAAAELIRIGDRIALRLGWSKSARRRGACAALGLAISLGVSIQLKPSHPSRWGHQAAGRWLAAHARPSEAVLDTRGWAAFVSGLRSYDPWHIRQALTDAQLAYVVIGTDELTAPSRRAATLRAVLAYAARPVAEFPERRDRPGRGPGVRIYRYRRPASWEGFQP